MECTDCFFICIRWETMKLHYKTIHPEIKNPSSFFTKEARQK